MKFEINETNIKHAEKMYRSRSNNRLVKIFLGLNILIFIFFMLSSFIFPPKLTGKDAVTVFGETYSFSTDRSFVLLSEEYCEEQKTMELLVQFTNSSFDGVNDYYIMASATGFRNSKIEIETPVKNELLYVIRITNLNSFDECVIQFAPAFGVASLVQEQDVGSIIINKHNNHVTSAIDFNKTEHDYLVERINFVTDSLKNKLDESVLKVTELEKQIKGIKEENKNIEKEAEYLTSVEAETAEQKIISNEEKIEELEEQLAEEKINVALNQKNYEDALEKKEDLAKEN